jgi:hypothetical protein
MNEKGQSHNQLVMVSVIFAILAVASFSGIAKSFDKGGLYDEYSKNIPFTDVVSEAAVKKIYEGGLKNFADEAKASLPGASYLKNNCNEWYLACGGQGSPWSKSPASVADLAAVDVLGSGCGESAWRPMAEEWAKNNPNFTKQGKEGQYYLLVNACRAELMGNIVADYNYGR